MLCEILYLENSDKARFDNLEKCVENDYVLDQVEYTRTVTALYNLLLNYQPSCNSKNSQSNGVSNQLMFAQSEKTGDGEGYVKDNEQIPRRNINHITCKKCGEKGHCAGNSECPNQANLKEDAKAYRKMKQEKSSPNPPGGGY